VTLMLAAAADASAAGHHQLIEPGRPCVYNAGFAHATAVVRHRATERLKRPSAAGADMALPRLAAPRDVQRIHDDGLRPFEKMITDSPPHSGVNLI
jgi:hypothetical protein